MSTRRSERSQRARDRRNQVTLVVGIIGVSLAGLLIITAVVRASSSPRDDSNSMPSISDTPTIPDKLESTSSLSATETTIPIVPSVEVPDVSGMSRLECEALLTAAGLIVEIREVRDAATAGTGPDAAVGTDPPAGARVASGSTIAVLVPASAEVVSETVERGFVVCIDPGHQSKSDLSPEPIGPGASQTKERVRGGATGVSTRIPEYEIALQISMNLKDRLEDAGLTVVMTRDSNDVNISNSERAIIANEVAADLFVRIHADGSPNPEVAGITTLYPGANTWTKGIAEESKRAADLVHAAVVGSTGAVSLGTVQRTDLTGFNWSEVPTVLVECGFMSNPVEDRLLASPHYQTKLATGMAVGILEYLGG